MFEKGILVIELDSNFNEIDHNGKNNENIKLSFKNKSIDNSSINNQFDALNDLHNENSNH